MKSEKIGNILDRPYGYEIAKLLNDSEKSFSEIKSGVNADWDAEIQRILTDGENKGIIEVPPTRGGKKYTLNTELFTENQLEEIESKADQRGNNTPSHVDTEGSKSMWEIDDDDDDDPDYRTPM